MHDRHGVFSRRKENLIKDGVSVYPKKIPISAQGNSLLPDIPPGYTHSIYYQTVADGTCSVSC